MKVGDYVRTDTGVIEKLEGIHEQNKTNKTIIKLNKMGGGRYAHILDINSEFTKEFDEDFSRGNIIKSSPNIIDLIEVGDYVNGVLIEEIYEKGNDKLFIHTFDTEIMMCFTNNNINSIVTREMFESMEYKVKE